MSEKKTMKDYIHDAIPLIIRNITIENRKPKYTLSTSKFKSKKNEFFDPCLKEGQINDIGRKQRRHFKFENMIDLHGLTASEAFDRLLIFFMKCQKENIKKVIVITGGNALKKSVIRSSFVKWLRESFGNYVTSCSQANIQHGGQGAFYVVLKSIIKPQERNS